MASTSDAGGDTAGATGSAETSSSSSSSTGSSSETGEVPTGGSGGASTVDGTGEVVVTTAGETGVGESGVGESGDTGGSSETGEAPICVDAPACASVEGSAVEHHLTLLDGCAFALQPGDFAAGTARADQLLARVGTAVTVEAVLGQLNRVAVPGLSAYQAERMKNHDFVGFRWNDGDGAVDYWYPQGMTGGSDARDDGRVGGRRVVLISWYHHIERAPSDPPSKGVRLSLVDITDMKDIHYRHLLLVTPTGDGDSVDFKAVNNGDGDALHAGGIVWIGDRLYVAETYAGFRVFDMARMFETTATMDEDAIGIGDTIDAHGYRYAVPEIGRYDLTEDSCPFRFSSSSLDRSASPPVLVTAEYQTDQTGRVARWPIDLTTAALVTNGGTVHAQDAAFAGQSRTQGAVTYEGVYYMSCSSQAEQWGRLYRNVPDKVSEITAWVDGPEDLYVERDLGLIWTTAEHPDKRVTLGIPMQGY